jgi:class 3 adenylate cyclase
MSILFAATCPDRVLSLTLVGSFARFSRSRSHPWMPTPEERAVTQAQAVEFWGTGWVLATMFDYERPSAEELERLARLEMASASPDAVSQIFAMNQLIDVGGVLATVRVPTLVVHDLDDHVVPVACGRYLAEHIPNARLVETTGVGHGALVGERWAAGDEIIEFITGARPVDRVDRVLATVLFTDIVGSTERAATEGDARWRKLLDRHDEITRAAVAEHLGVAVKSTGDGFLAHFDGPGRAVRCAEVLGRRLREVGLDVRAGLHTGEIELRGDDIGGLAVHVASRVAGLAGAGEVLVSRTVKDLTVGSDLAYVDRGEHELKGVPDRWQVYEVAR